MKKQKTIHRLPETNIVIDYWKASAEGRDTCIRFMTVLRVENDQLQSMKQHNYKIYTSSNNKKLLEFHKIPTNRIIAIELGTCIEIVDEYANYSFKVSTIESNYCAGSCMFLFQGPFGNILYTGFFRPAKSSDPLRDPILQRLIQDKLLDEVYIDNSYAAEHCQFPSRADVITETVHLIEKHPLHKIIIAGNRFGKEEILRDIAMALNEHIGVSKSKYEELSFIMTQQSLEKFSPSQDECRIIVEDELLSLKQCKKKQVEEGLCIIILLTARYVCEKMRCGMPIPQLSNLHILPYSSHASHNELMEFLYNLNARKIIPILSESDNTTIPKKMMEMCYTDEDSISLYDSDFYFDTFTNIQTSRNECSSVHETNNFCHNRRNPINDVSHNNMLIERTCNNSRDETMDSDAFPSNIGSVDEEIDSVDADIYHESKSVAFISLLEVQDEYFCNETSNFGDTEDLIDPLYISDSSDVSTIGDSVKTRHNFVCAESTARSSIEKFQDHGITSSVSESNLMNEAQPLHILPLDVVNNKKINKIEKNAHAVSNLKTSGNEEMHCDEISSSDIGSDGPIGKHSEALPNNNNNQSEMEVNSESGILCLSISDLRNNNNNVELNDCSSLLIGESVNEKDIMKLGTVLHHIRLVTTAKDWQRTNLTEDTWATLQGAEFF